VKIVFINVKYSPNLGDGVISECLENALRKRLDNIEIVNCDLAGRTEFSARRNLMRSIALSVLPHLPHRIKGVVVKHLLEDTVRRSLMPIYKKQMDNADIAIFGGGQILADADLNFPMKVAAAAAVARENGQIIAIHGVGVGEVWSHLGGMLFREAFSGYPLAWTSVRDELSMKRWRSHFAGADIPNPHLSFDPGLLAQETYGPVNGDGRAGKNRPRIGLCITSPATLKLHFDGGDTLEAPVDKTFYRDTVNALAERGLEILLFTNGAADDESFLRKCFPRPFLRNFETNQISIAARSIEPANLVDTIRNCDGIIAHRLHANIIAYSYKIPHVGLGLNRKVDQFFFSAGRSNFVLGPDQLEPNLIAQKMQEALEVEIPDEAHKVLTKQIHEDLNMFAAAIKKAANGRQSNGAGRQVPMDNT